MAKQEPVLKTDHHMSRRESILAWVSIVLCTLAATLPVASRAQSAPEAWQWRATIYAWAPALDGETSFAGGGGGGSVGISGSDILKALNFTFMGALEAHKGRWGVGTDVIYLDLEDSRSETRNLSLGGNDLPVGVTADLDLNISGWLWTIAGSYRVVDEPLYSIDLLTGARLLKLGETLSWQFNGNIGSLPLPGPSGKSHASATIWDGIVGVRGRAGFGAKDRWFVTGQVDIVTGRSDLTCQAALGAGYRFNWGEIAGLWRYLDYNLGSGRAIQGLTLNGPALAASFRF